MKRRGGVLVVTLVVLLLVPLQSDASSTSVTFGPSPDPHCTKTFPITTQYLGGPEVNKVTAIAGTLRLSFYDLRYCGHLNGTTGQVLFLDSATKITPGPGCIQTIGRLVTCQLGRLVIDLGDGDDYLAMVLSPEVDAGEDLPGGGMRGSSINGGGGNDHLRTVNRSYDLVACGPGDDTVLADAGDQINARDQIDADCEHVSFL